MQSIYPYILYILMSTFINLLYWLFVILIERRQVPSPHTYNVNINTKNEEL